MAVLVEDIFKLSDTIDIHCESNKPRESIKGLKLSDFLQLSFQEIKDNPQLANALLTLEKYPIEDGNILYRMQIEKNDEYHGYFNITKDSFLKTTGHDSEFGEVFSLSEYFKEQSKKGLDLAKFSALIPKNVLAAHPRIEVYKRFITSNSDGPKISVRCFMPPFLGVAEASFNPHESNISDTTEKQLSIFQTVEPHLTLEYVKEQQETFKSLEMSMTGRYKQ